MHPVLDSLDNYNILSERMNVLELFIFPVVKIGIASDLRKVKTGVIDPRVATLFLSYMYLVSRSSTL